MAGAAARERVHRDDSLSSEPNHRGCPIAILLFRSVAGALTTPPAMSASGEIFVATAEALFCLSRAK